jgi:thiol-disulfide isomerase/thioredoxin
MLKKTLFFLFFIFTLIIPLQNILAQEASTVSVYFFWGEGCPHCEKEKPFLEKMREKYPELKIHEFEIWNNADNRQLMIDFGKKLNTNVSGVPFTVVGEQYVIGWLDEKYTGKKIENAIQCSINNHCVDIGADLINPDLNSKNQNNTVLEESSLIPETMTLPIVGEIKTKNLSLPLLTIILGALDGFNPCAMWTLLFLISLLLGMKDRKRMWILGSAFIIASATVYFLFMAAWLNLLLFIGFIVWIRVIIGLVALGGGVYNLREFFVSKQSGCKVTGDEKRQRVFEKLKAITQKQQFWLALGGVIILAAAVNLVELICSAGFPVVFTQILALSSLAKWQYYLYMLLYIFVFMLDDLFVFFVAMITLQMTGISTKYTRFSHLVGGILMVIIGILLIFKPEWLMFG